MRKLRTIVVLTFFALILSANDVVAQEVLLDNVVVARQNTTFTIAYDLSFADEDVDSCNIALMLSTDGGETFGKVDMQKLSGDVGRITTPGQESIKYDFEKDKNLLAGKSLVFKVEVVGKEGDSTITVKTAVDDIGANGNETVQSTSDENYENGYEYVDLGLSVKWATCNVGATKPEEYGDYFAWGETSPKSDYSMSTLKYRTSGDNWGNVKFSKYVRTSQYGTVDNRITLELSDDAAHANWGGSWRMPTHAELEELLNRGNCKWIWTTQNGVKGYKVVSRKSGYEGNYIFLPAAGCRDGAGLDYSGSYGYYWSSSLSTDDPYDAWRLYFYSGLHGTYNYGRRYYGHSVRPVCP